MNEISLIASKPIMKATRSLALFLTLTLLASCQKKDAATATDAAAEAQRLQTALLRQEREEAEAARAQAALDKEEALRLRNESEQLRAEAELRQSVAKLTEEVEKDSGEKTTSTPEPAVVAQPEQHAVPEDVSYQPFYNDLADEGSWMDSADYGYVWQPSLSSQSDWAPYTDGSWAYSDYGWTWESQERFGGICYHYGRWTKLRSVGWVWVPGHDWAPAWVSWRSGGDCIGWAPLPPRAKWNAHVGIHGWVDGTCQIPPARYCFVPLPDLCHPRCKEVLLPQKECEHRYLQTHNVTSFTEVKTPGSKPMVRCDGPKLEEVRPRLKDKLHERKLHFQEGNVAALQPRVQAESGTIPVRQWNLRPASNRELARPQAVARQIDPALDQIETPARQNRQAIQRLVATEATQALQKAPPPKMDRGPEPRPQATRPRLAVSEPAPSPNIPTVSNEHPVGQLPAVEPVAEATKELAENQRALDERQDQLAAQQAKLQHKQKIAAQHQQQETTQQAETERQRARDQKELTQRQTAMNDKLGEAQRQAAQREKQETARRAEAERQQALTEAQQQKKEEWLRQHALAETERAQQEAAQRQADLRDKQEAARRAEAERQQAMAEAQRLKKEEWQRQQAMAETQRQQQEEVQRQKKEEWQRQQAMVEARRQQQEDANRKQQEDAQRQKKEEWQRQQAMAEAHRQQQEEAQRQKKEEWQRQQQEAAQKARESSGGKNGKR